MTEAMPGSLVGRSTELEDLRSFLDRVARGTGRILLIEGEGGIGKSRLLQASIAHADGLGFTIATGHAYEVERDRPFGALVDALHLRAGHDPQRDEIAALLRGTTNRRDLSDVRFLIVERIVDLIETESTRAPVLIAIEDIHWADPSTLLVLHRLSAATEYLPVAVICTIRPTPRSSEVQTTLRALEARGAQDLALRPLEPGAVADLVAATLDATPGARLLEKISGAGGNPLFITELIGALASEDLIDTIEGIAEAKESSLPPSLALTILRRIAFLSDTALEALRIAAVLGVAFSVKDLTIVAQRSAAAFVGAIDEARAAGLLEQSGDHLVFRHELVRDAIYQDMLEPVRKALHRQAARALADAGASATQVASHMSLGAEPNDLEAAMWLERAASDTAAQAPLVSVDLLERAVALVSTDVRRREELSLALAWAQLNASRPRDAETVARLLTESARRDVRQEARRAQALALNFQGEWQSALEMLDEALSDPELSPSEHARLQGERSFAVMMFNREDAGSEAEAAIRMGREHSEPISLYLGHLTVAWCHFFDGRFTEAFAAVDGAIEHAAAVRGDDPRAAEGDLLRCWILAFSDRIEEAEAAFDRYRRRYEDGSWVKWARYYTGLSYLYFNTGRWDEAVVEAHTGASASEEAGLHNDAAICRQLLCAIAIGRDDLSAAEDHLHRIPGGMWTSALVAEAKNDGAGLNEILTSYRPTIGSSRPWHMPVVAMVARDWVRLYLSSGDVDAARAMTAVIEEAALRSPIASFEAAALGCRGLVENSADLLLASVDRLRRSPRTAARARACEDAASAVAATGATEDAIALLLESIELYESLGAVREVARADASLRALGVRRGRRGPRRRPRFGWESLTQTEQRVVALVAEGHTYRETGQRLFISRRTVETHMAHVFTKLGISSRRELVETARGRGA